LGFNTLNSSKNAKFKVRACILIVGLKQGGSDNLSHYSGLFKRANEAKTRLAERKKAQVEKKTSTSPIIFQLPLWAEALRCLPNEIAHSALFNAKNRRQPRLYLKQAEIAVIGDGRITFTGEELRQDDETVWLQLVHLAKERPLGNLVEFTPYSLCKAIGWSIDGRSYKRLRQCLNRMQATALSIYSKRLQSGISLSMIPMFRWQDEAGNALAQYQIKVAQELVALFGENHYTRLEMEQRKALPDGIATWLHSYYASHSKPYPVKLGTLKFGAGLGAMCDFETKRNIRRALCELKDVGFLESFKIVGELVHVIRKN